MTCAKCGAVNPDTASLCRVCQSPLVVPTQILDDEPLTPREQEISTGIGRGLGIVIVLFLLWAGWRIVAAVTSPPSVTLISTRTVQRLTAGPMNYDADSGAEYVIAKIRVDNPRILGNIATHPGEFRAVTPNRIAHQSYVFWTGWPDNVVWLPTVQVMPGGAVEGEVVFMLRSGTKVLGVEWSPVRR